MLRHTAGHIEKYSMAPTTMAEGQEDARSCLPLFVSAGVSLMRMKIATLFGNPTWDIGC